MEGLLKGCNESNKLHPMLHHHIHKVGDYVVKIPLAAGETDLYRNCHDSRLTRLNDENAFAATRLIKRYTFIPLPKLILKGKEAVISVPNCLLSRYLVIQFQFQFSSEMIQFQFQSVLAELVKNW